MLCLLLSVAVISGGCTAATATGGQTGPAAVGGLVISEVMSSNNGSVKAPDGSTPDWIELHNTSDKTIALKGYMLSDNPRKPDKYVFEAGNIPAGGYLVLYATGKATVSAGTMYLPFKLSSSGEELTLMTPGVNTSDRFVTPALPSDISYGLDGPDPDPKAAKVYFGEPTPGKANGADGKTTAESAMKPVETTLLINEYCTRNSTLYDDNGDSPDWVELYNSGSKDLDLTGYGLSDDITNLDKWLFPEVSIKAKGYLLLMLAGKPDPTSGATESENGLDSKGRLHVDFGLSGQDTQVILTDNRGRTVSSAAVEDLPLNVSKGRLRDDPNSWGYFATPTPGLANTSASFKSVADIKSSVVKDVLVSEVFATDDADAAKPEADWIELYNATDKKIDLAGYGLSDDSGDPYRMRLENISIAAKSRVVVTPDTFGISPLGETILLTDSKGLVHDSFPTGHLRAGMSSGRQVGTGTTADLARVFYSTPTKAEPNSTTAYKTYADVPTISVKTEAGGKAVDGLYITGTVLVTISSADKNATIHYTIDGSKPSASSSSYSAPIRVDKSTVVKAIAVVPGEVSSDSVSRTLLKEARHSLPVVSLSGDPAALTGANGILTAAAEGELPVEFAFYEADGRLGIDVQAGTELHGQFSRTEKQKSVELMFRSSYGASEITYPFFPDSKVKTFRRLVLRTSGQDWKITKVRDAYMTRIMAGHMDLDYMAIRECVVYVNGKYWGLYDLREKLDQFYLASHYGVDPNKVDLIKGNNMEVAGKVDDMKDLIAYVKAHDLTDDAAYKKVLARIDEESLMDFIIAESFFSNVDSGNKKFWRVQSDKGQWHWMIFDMDWAMFPSTYKSDRLYGDLLDPGGHGSQNLFSTALQVGLMKNPDFKEAFIKRYAKFLNTAFETDRMLKILDDSVDIIKDEMPRQIARWGLPGSVQTWERAVATLRTITSEKRGLMIAQLRDSFDLSQATMKQLFPEDF